MTLTSYSYIHKVRHCSVIGYLCLNPVFCILLKIQICISMWHSGNRSPETFYKFVNMFVQAILSEQIPNLQARLSEHLDRAVKPFHLAEDNAGMPSNHFPPGASSSWRNVSYLTFWSVFIFAKQACPPTTLHKVSPYLSKESFLPRTVFHWLVWGPVQPWTLVWQIFWKTNECSGYIVPTTHHKT